MDTALDTRTLTNVIDGRSVAPSAGGYMDLIDPCTGDTSARSPLSDAADVDAAFAAAARAFQGWRSSTPSQRQAALLALAADLEANAAEIAELESSDTGKPLHLMYSEEIGPSIDHLRFFAGAARILEGRSAAEYLPGHTSFVRREPIGVIAQITPWNYPLMMAMWKIAPAIAAGNTVVLKPAETTPSSAIRLAELAARHLPEGVLNVVCGDRTTGQLVAGHSGGSMIALTGSERAGIDVGIEAARRAVPAHLELGGKAPALVFADAATPANAASIIGASFFNAGQDCTAVTRVLVHSSVVDQFTEELVVAAKRTSTGPREDDVDFGPLNSAEHLARVEGFVTGLPAHATVATGGNRIDRAGWFFEPTVITGVEQHDEIVQHEVFGPVITVQSFDTDSEAVELANGVRQGLASSIWTRDHSRAMKLSTELNFGYVWINTHMAIVAEMPHGGFGSSGHSPDLSTYGFEEYTRVKHVMSEWAE